MQIDLVEEAKILLQSVAIPSPPRLLMDIQGEINKPEPDYKILTEYVKQDMAMTARMIKIANSPFFGIRYPVDSIQTALSVLGLENFKQIIVSAALREAMKSSDISLKDFEAFYTHSMWVAQSAFLLAKQKFLEHTTPDHAYLTGLFHNCGMVMLTKKYSTYFELLRKQPVKADSLILFEETHFRTNHAIVGRFVAGAWELPDLVSRAIAWHHEKDLFRIEDDSLRELTAILILAGTLTFHLTNKNFPNLSFFHHCVRQRNKFQLILRAAGLRLNDYIQVEEKIKKIIYNE